MAIWSRLTGAIAAIGIGGAGAAAVEPVLEVPRQHAWQGEPNRVLDLGTVAHLIAQGLVSEAAATDEVSRNGYNGNRLKAMVQLQLRAPTLAETLELWRRGRFGAADPANAPAQVLHALNKAQIEEQYHAAILDLFHERLDPAVVATAIQRTILPNPGILPHQPPTAGSNVPPMPQAAVDPIAEALAMGIDVPRLEALTRIVGLPASPDLAARMHFRNIITEGAFNQAILEGNTRGEWAPFLLDGFREILTAHDYAELQLRGFRTRTERLAGTAKHGMSVEDSDLLYDVLGRSIPVHQITTGLARGGKWTGAATTAPEPYLATLQRGNLRPEYYDLAYSNRYTYPSAFVIRALLKDGVWTAAKGEQILLENGWRPDLAHDVAVHYAPTGLVAADPHVTKAQGQLWTATHKSYIAAESADADVTPRLNLLGVPGPAQSQVLDLWRSERELIRAQLSPAQIRKAVKGAVTNPATGGPWDNAAALVALEARGYSHDDAVTFLAE